MDLYARPGLIGAIVLIAIVAIASFTVPTLAQNAPPPCSSDSTFSWLDFWLGDWNVYSGEQLVGSNHIEKILEGCAVTEDWTSARGSHGQSLFYYLPATRTWKQVWVTESALLPGGVKEKQLVERQADGGLRFQGEISRSDTTSYLDRTTLSPISADSVRQLIEISTNEGSTWKTTFDAIYVRKKQ